MRSGIEFLTAAPGWHCYKYVPRIVVLAALHQFAAVFGWAEWNAAAKPCLFGVWGALDYEDAVAFPAVICGAVVKSASDFATAYFLTVANDVPFALSVLRTYLAVLRWERACRTLIAFIAFGTLRAWGNVAYADSVAHDVQTAICGYVALKSAVFQAAIFAVFAVVARA